MWGKLAGKIIAAPVKAVVQAPEELAKAVEEVGGQRSAVARMGARSKRSALKRI